MNPPVIVALHQIENDIFYLVRKNDFWNQVTDNPLLYAANDSRTIFLV